MSAFDFGDHGYLQPRWEVQQKIVGAVVIVGDRGLLYGDDSVDHADGTSTLFLVVRDLGTGEENARVQMPGDVPPLAHSIIAAGESIYFLSPEFTKSNGTITRVYTGSDDDTNHEEEPCEKEKKNSNPGNLRGGH